LASRFDDLACGFEHLASRFDDLATVLFLY
jgi:hypothetical protein